MEQLSDKEYILDVGEKFTNKKTGKTHEVEAGVCPNCGNSSLEYEGKDFEGDAICYYWHCEECNSAGTEWYSIEFTGHNITLSK
jgi:C4-type Zn-finger protein